MDNVDIIDEHDLMLDPVFVAGVVNFCAIFADELTPAGIELCDRFAIINDVLNGGE